MSRNVISLISRVRIVLLCGDKRIATSLASKLRGSGATVTVVDDPELVFDNIEEVKPDAVWVVASGDDALRFGQLCRLMEVDNVMYPHPWKLFWVGDHVPDGLSVLAGSFPTLPGVDQMIEASRGG